MLVSDHCSGGCMMIILHDVYPRHLQTSWSYSDMMFMPVSDTNLLGRPYSEKNYMLLLGYLF